MAFERKNPPWLSVWLQPRETIAQVVKENPQQRVVILSAIYGLPMILHIMQTLGMGHSMPAVAVLIISMILSTFIGMLSVAIISWLLQTTGKWIGGKASFDYVRAAVCWSNVPNVPSIAMWLCLIAMFGKKLFTPFFVQTDLPQQISMIVTLIYLVQLVMNIWGIFILVLALSEVQEFSIGKALLNMAIPCVLVIGGFWFLLWLTVSFTATGAH